MNQPYPTSLKRLSILLLCATLVLLIKCHTTSTQSKPVLASTVPNHQLWTKLLQKHVESSGFVNYKGFIQDSSALNLYLRTLQAGVPDPNTWTQEEQLAYWINAYNAYTIKLIVNKYPLKSIKDLNSTIAIPFVNTIWDRRFFTLGGRKYSLNKIEHEILRKKFHEPRIHFAINCASVSCPVLRREAYTAAKLEQQLSEQAITFINDPTKNQLSSGNPKLSSIFNWFGSDFKKDGSIISFINRYSSISIKEDASVEYLEYDWRLNEQ
ncbi:DUF547 domain-containing protein [Pontibacter sp. H249]|uniref:DUF547 domain-containing protein n=1 Tax=Pontibacter sp. H249 TaxID=3133420 RepID=UPI0030C29ACA